MMNLLSPSQLIKRKPLHLAMTCLYIAGCIIVVPAKSANPDQQRRFKGVGMMLVVDAVPSAEMRQVVFQDDRNVQIYTSSLVAKINREILQLTSTHVPITIRAVWGEGRHYDFSRATWYGGTILGDYTIPVASRIPDEILNDIRARGGLLRLKFRLKPDGIMFGWDIERDGGGISRFDMPGGDFVETRY